MQEQAVIRREILAKRDALTAAEHLDKSQKICETISSHQVWLRAFAILFFVPFRSEVAIKPLFTAAWQQGKQVIAPRSVISTRQLELYRIYRWDDLTSGNWGILEPKESLEKVDVSRVDLVIVPGSVFDRTGGRWGYGMGFYDRFLATCRHDTIRLAPHFAVQLVDKLSLHSHDQKMHLLVNEEETIELLPSDNSDST